MFDPILEFYESLAPDYALIFGDWRSSVARQADTLDLIIRRLPGTPVQSILDCSSGMGTQAIGLALKGYRVHATDLSPTLVARGQKEAQELGANLTWGVVDFRQLQSHTADTFDLVLSCDNALPHLLTVEDLQRALQSFWNAMNLGGHLFVSLRDYDRILEEPSRSTLPVVHGTGADRRIVFQVWDWQADGLTYELQHFMLFQKDGEWVTRCRRGVYRALRRAELTQLLVKLGFHEVTFHEPPDSGYYQPIVTARRPP